MKIFIAFLISLSLLSCSEGAIEEFSFRKTLEFSLVDLCGAEDKDCIEAVKSQIVGCMEKSDWRAFFNDDDNPDELKRFTGVFYACIVDKDGEPYFVIDEAVSTQQTQAIE